MSRRPKLPKPHKIKRNPLARELASGKFRVRVVKRVDAYQRRPKHTEPPEDGA